MLVSLDAPPKTLLAKNLKAARERAGLTQEQAAAKTGFSKQAISGWERGAYAPTEANLGVVADVYGTTREELRYSAGVVSESVAEPYSPNPALKNRLRPRPRARVYEHIQTMVTAGCTIEQIDEAERLMIDAAFNKLNARDPRDRSDEEMIVDIDDAWDWIKEVLGRAGVKGLK